MQLRLPLKVASLLQGCVCTAGFFPSTSQSAVASRLESGRVVAVIRWQFPSPIQCLAGKLLSRDVLQHIIIGEHRLASRFDGASLAAACSDKRRASNKCAFDSHRLVVIRFVIPGNDSSRSKPSLIFCYCPVVIDHKGLVRGKASDKQSRKSNSELMHARQVKARSASSDLWPAATETNEQIAGVSVANSGPKLDLLCLGARALQRTLVSRVRKVTRTNLTNNLTAQPATRPVADRCPPSIPSKEKSRNNLQCTLAVEVLFP